MDGASLTPHRGERQDPRELRVPDRAPVGDQRGGAGLVGGAVGADATHETRPAGAIRGGEELGVRSVRELPDQVIRPIWNAGAQTPAIITHGWTGYSVVPHERWRHGEIGATRVRARGLRPRERSGTPLPPRGRRGTG